MIFLSGNILFFGCRNREKDYLCKEEWELAVNKGYLELYTAFSRDQVRSSWNKGHAVRKIPKFRCWLFKCIAGYLNWGNFIEVIHCLLTMVGLVNKWWQILKILLVSNAHVKNYVQERNLIYLPYCSNFHQYSFKFVSVDTLSGE